MVYLSGMIEVKRAIYSDKFPQLLHFLLGNVADRRRYFFSPAFCFLFRGGSGYISCGGGQQIQHLKYGKMDVRVWMITK